MYEQIIYDVQDPVATITLNRPEKLNALTTRMRQEVDHALADAEQREDVVGIVLTGAGRAFCAGVDMGELQQIQAAGSIDAVRGDAGLASARPGDPSMRADFARQLGYLLTVRKPVIAAVNGPCAGMGFSYAVFCDLRFVSEQSMFITSYAQRGLVAEHGTSWMLPRLLGPSRALDLLWSARRVDGAEALQLGLANRLVPAERLVEEAQGYVRTLASTVAPWSLMQMKQQIYRQLMQTYGPAMEDTERLMDESVALPHFKEGIASFMERRPPRFARIQG